MPIEGSFLSAFDATIVGKEAGQDYTLLHVLEWKERRDGSSTTGDA
jgi:hypothetical protein